MQTWRQKQALRGYGLRFETLNTYIDDKDLEVIGNTAAKLNASAVLWGTVIDKETVYFRFWSPNNGVSRSPNPASITDISRLAELSTEIWQSIERQAENAQATKWGVKREREEILALRREISQLREIVTSGLIAPIVSGQAVPSELKAVLIGVANYPGMGADLKGPLNDVAKFRSTLISRNSTWKVSVLLNEAATRKTIRELIQETESEIDENGLLLVYFSGHGTVTKDGKAFFLPYDYAIKGDAVTGIDLKELVEATMGAHAQTVFITDTPFDPDKVASGLLKQGGILSAGTRPDQVFEAQWRGKTFGSFTAALIETLESTPKDLPITLDGLYGSASLIVKRQHQDISPRLVAGPQAPRL